eukprot:TRINITY_DN4685_c0_g1_i1.p1 TRINITY_DN4685_c0_g1~~TRINITY_DN4685_c0_g1_i1.p1  ORF type:complete len:483 (-),score=109.40 TRINITY_DN4685_c0_g1_i1:45-1493(-)
MCIRDRRKPRQQRYAGSVPVQRPKMPPLPTESVDAPEEAPKPTLWCEELQRAVLPSEVQLLCAGLSVRSLHEVASEARHKLTAAMPALAAKQLHTHQTCAALDTEMERFGQLLDGSKDQIDDVFARLKSVLELHRRQLHRDLDLQSNDMKKTVASVRGQIIQLGNNLHTASCTITTALASDDNELLRAMDPLCGTIVALCTQADEAAVIERPVLHVHVCDEQQLQGLEDRLRGVAKLKPTWSPAIPKDWGWVAPPPLLAQGSTLIRSKDSLGDGFTCALSQCCFHRGKHHWEIELLCYGQNSTEHAQSALLERMQVQERAVAGLSLLSPTALQAVRGAGVWQQVKAAGDQATIRHAEVVVGVCAADAPAEQALERGCGYMTGSGGLLLHGSSVCCYGEPVPPHGVLGLSLDLVTKELSFSINGRPLGIAVGKEVFAELGPLRPFVAMSMPGASVRLRSGESCLLYTSPSPRDRTRSRMPSSA